MYWLKRFYNTFLMQLQGTLEAMKLTANSLVKKQQQQLVIVLLSLF